MRDTNQEGERIMTDTHNLLHTCGYINIHTTYGYYGYILNVQTTEDCRSLIWYLSFRKLTGTSVIFWRPGHQS